MRYNGAGREGKLKKFSPKWIGNYTITSAHGANAFVIESNDSDIIDTVNVSHLKRIVVPRGEDIEILTPNHRGRM